MENMTLTSAFALLIFVLVLKILFSDCTKNAAKAVVKTVKQGLLLKLCAIIVASLAMIPFYNFVKFALQDKQTSAKILDNPVIYSTTEVKSIPTPDSTNESCKVAEEREAEELLPSTTKDFDFVAEEKEEYYKRLRDDYINLLAKTTNQPIQSWVFTTSSYTNPITGEETEVQSWELASAPEGRYDVESYFNNDTWQLRSYALWAIDVDCLFSVKGDNGNIEKYCVVMSVNGAYVWLNLVDETVTYGEYGDNGYSREYTIKLSADEFYGDSNIYTIDEIGTTASGNLIRLFDEVCNLALYMGHSDCPTQSGVPQASQTDMPTKDPVSSMTQQGYVPTESDQSIPDYDGHQNPGSETCEPWTATPSTPSIPLTTTPAPITASGDKIS